jgi:Tol biopolymer transport system component
MIKRLIVSLLFTLCCSVFSVSHAALSQDPSLHWRTLYTEHFEIHFHDNEQALAQQVGAICERVHQRLATRFNWQPAQRTQVVLTDRFDYANGQAFPIPRNTMTLLVTPPDSTSVLGDYDDWLEMLIIHEYTHILHIDKASGIPATLRNILGRWLFLFPNMLQPGWFIEGIATYEETDTARGIGRGQNSMFRMLMRLEVEHGIKPLQQANQPLVSWPLNTVRYLYGVYFYQFIAERYGEDKIRGLVDNYSNNILPFAINSNSLMTLDKKLPALWTEFEQYLREDFISEAEAIRARGETAGERLTQHGYFTGEPQIAANGDVYFVRNDLESEAQLLVLKGGQQPAQVVTDARGANFDLHPRAGIVMAEIDAYRDTSLFSDLYHIDPISGKRTRLTEGARYLYATWSPDGQHIVAVHNETGEHALHLLDAQGQLQEVLWQGNDKTVLGAPDWSPDGSQLVLAVWHRDTLWNLEGFDLETHQWHKLTSGPAIEATPRFSADGKAILYSADYDGVFNLRKLEIDSGRITTLSNVVGGAFAPAAHPRDGSLYYLGAHHQGYDLYRLPQPLSLTQEPATNAPQITPATHNTADNAPRNENTSLRIVEKQSEDDAIEDYNALARIAPTSWFPYWFLTEDRNEIGFSTWGRDPLQRHSYSLLLAYDTKNSWPVGSFRYVYDRWNPTLKFSLSRQAVVYLNDDDTVERFRNEDIATAELVWPFLSYQRQWLLHTGLVSDTESDQEVRSTLGPAPTFNDELVGLAVSFNSARRYARAISPSYGRQLRLTAEDAEVLNSDYSGQIYSLDWREFIDLPGQHVLATRLVAGWGTESPRPFRLGGSLDTSVSPHPQNAALAPTDAIFGQRRYPLFGYDDGRADLRGRRMALLVAEWRFPIALIERGLMAPPVGIHQFHGSLFYNWGETWNQGSDIPALRRGAGAELTTELVLGYWLPVKLRIGVAKGFDLGGEEQGYVELGAIF